MSTNHPRRHPIVFTGLAALRLIGIGGLIAAAIFWWPVQSELSTNKIVATAYTAGLVLAPPALWSFIFPWSPGGMLLLRIQARTAGLYIVGAAALYFLYYSFQLQWAWWQAQPAVADTNMIAQQVCVGLLLYIVIPGLVWTPIAPDELYTQIQQDQLVQRYTMQTRADMAILDTQLLRTQQLTAVGMANLLAAERQELAASLSGLVTGMDTTLQRIAGNMNAAAETVYGQRGRDLFSAPPFADDLGDILGYVGQAIGGTRMQLAAPETGDATIEIPSVNLEEENRRLSSELAALRLRHASRGTLIEELLAEEAANQAPGRLESRSAPAAPRRAAPRYAAEYETAIQRLEPFFTVRQVAELLGDSPERTARDVVDAWHTQGWIEKGNIRGQWRFLTEDEAQP